MQCKIKDITINYEVLGEGKPILLLHGYTLDHNLMVGCMEPIFHEREGYRRIYIDLPGMGRSSSAPWIDCSDKMLDIVLAFIEEILPNTNFLLAGESYGGYLARGILYKMVHRVDGLLLLCPVIEPDSSKRKVPNHEVLKADRTFISKLSTGDVEDFTSTFVVQNEEIYDRFQKEILTGIKLADKPFLDTLKKNGYSFTFQVDELSKEYDKPTLFLLGKQDSCVGYEDAWKTLRNFPRASYAILDQAGHNLQIEQGNLFHSLVNDWFIRVEEADSIK